MARKLGSPIKTNGALQREDTVLTPEITGALVQKVVSGESLFTKEGTKGYIELCVNAQEAPILLSRSTLKSWIQRGNVLPDGDSLRVILDRAREEYRASKIREMDEKREEIIDHKFNRVIGIRTKEPVVGMFGVVKDKDTGKVLKRENVKLLSEQMKNVRFLAERLNPSRYGRVEKTENKHLVFSLSDLRRYAQERKEAGYSEDALDQPRKDIGSSGVIQEFAPQPVPLEVSETEKPASKPAPKQFDFSKLSKETLQKLKNDLGTSLPQKREVERTSYVPIGNIGDPFDAAGLEPPPKGFDDASLSSI